MTESDITRVSLLVRMRDPRDQQAWSEFVEIYSPLIYGIGRKNGLQDADAVDVTQEVLRIVARSISHWDYDVRRGSFRGWLFTIVRNELKDWFAKQRSAWVGTGNSSALRQLEEIATSDDKLSAVWELEHQQRVFSWAAARVRGEVQASTWQAFWKTAVENQAAAVVAAELGMSVANVYVAKSRVMARMKEVIRHVEDVA